MRVILKQDIKNMGQGGEIINVADGYARNYLIPKGLVVHATTRNMKQLEHDQRLIQARIKKVRAEAATVAERIEGLSVTISMLVGEGNRLFGSVSSKDIEEALREEGILVDRRNILVSEAVNNENGEPVIDKHIKGLGVYRIPVQLHSDVRVNLMVWIVAK